MFSHRTAGVLLSNRFHLEIKSSNEKKFVCTNFVSFFSDSLPIFDLNQGSNEREFFFDEESREFFFDRCPLTFPYILNYYRTGKLHFPKSNCLSSYEEELTFFRITPDAIGKLPVKSFFVSELFFIDKNLLRKNLKIFKKIRSDAKNHQIPCHND